MRNEKGWTPIVFMRLCSLPEGVRGCTCLDSDGNYNVYVNEAYCEDALNILWHEISHIKDNDFYSMSDIETIEEKADRAIITETDIKNLDIRAC